MSGFEVRNQNGAVTINSDQRHTVVVAQGAPSLAATGDMNRNTPFGNLSTLAPFLPASYPRSNNLYWFRMNAGAWSFPGAWYFQPGTVNIITTSRVQALQSGYLDVYDGGGGLIWSANSAGNMPRIQALLNIQEMNTDQVYSVDLSFNPFILLGACPGEASDDGTVAGQSGVLFRWTGGQLQYTWTNRLGKTFAQVFGGRGGLKIPLAYFNGR